MYFIRLFSHVRVFGFPEVTEQDYQPAAAEASQKVSAPAGRGCCFGTNHCAVTGNHKTRKIVIEDIACSMISAY
jgi:LDH2 family malate/lactate/ureidoglycolate dehydrogenase